MTLKMTEDDLLVAITDALTLYGYRWTHTRRSDKAQIMGHPGVPDIIAARNGVVWFIELKSQRGEMTQDQFAWMLELGWPVTSEFVHLRTWRPDDLDTALRELA